MKNKTKLKIILLLINALLIYLFFPIKTIPLVYLYPHAQKPYLTKNYPLNSLDLFFLKLFGAKEGWIRTPTHTTKIKLLKALLSNKREKSRTMIMYGGETIEEFTKKIAKQANLNRRKLLNYYNHNALFPEASIIAKRYHIPYNTNEINTIEHMLNKSYLTFLNLSEKYATPLNSKQFKNKVIIASIIEKETQKAQEMPLIASVIYNRLKRNMRLQMDATLNYKNHSHTIVTSQLIKKDNSKFNSYKHKGLPPQPIASVSLTSLDAAFNPAKTSYLYFVKSKDGKRHIFSAHYKMHLRNVKSYKQALEERRKLKQKLQHLIKKNLPILPPITSLPVSNKPIIVPLNSN